MSPGEEGPGVDGPMIIQSPTNAPTNDMRRQRESDSGTESEGDSRGRKHHMPIKKRAVTGPSGKPNAVAGGKPDAAATDSQDAPVGSDDKRRKPDASDSLRQLESSTHTTFEDSKVTSEPTLWGHLNLSPERDRDEDAWNPDLDRQGGHSTHAGPSTKARSPQDDLQENRGEQQPKDGADASAKDLAPASMEMCTCTTCFSELPLESNFGVSGQGSDGASRYHSECLVCRKLLGKLMSNGINEQDARRGLMKILGTEPPTAAANAAAAAPKGLRAGDVSAAPWGSLLDGGDASPPPMQISSKDSQAEGGSFKATAHGPRGHAGFAHQKDSRGYMMMPTPSEGAQSAGARHASRGGRAALDADMARASSMESEPNPALASSVLHALTGPLDRAPDDGEAAQQFWPANAREDGAAAPQFAGSPRVDVRTCSVCGETKPLLGNFHRSRTFGGKQYFRAQCSRCYSVVRKERRNRRAESASRAYHGKPPADRGTEGTSGHSAPLSSMAHPARGEGGSPADLHRAKGDISHDVARAAMDVDAPADGSPSSNLDLWQAIANRVSATRGMMNDSSMLAMDMPLVQEQLLLHQSPLMRMERGGLGEHAALQQLQREHMSQSAYLPKGDAGVDSSFWMDRPSLMGRDRPNSTLAGELLGRGVGLWGRKPNVMGNDVNQRRSGPNIQELAQQLLAQSGPQAPQQPPRGNLGMSDSALLACAIDAMYAKGKSMYPNTMQRLQLADIMLSQHSRNHRELAQLADPLSSLIGASGSSGLGLNGMQQGGGLAQPGSRFRHMRWDLNDDALPPQQPQEQQQQQQPPPSLRRGLLGRIADEAPQERDVGRDMSLAHAQLMLAEGPDRSPAQSLQQRKGPAEEAAFETVDATPAEARSRPGRPPNTPTQFKVCEICHISKPVEGYFSEHSKSHKGMTTYRRQCKGCFVLLKRLYRRGQTWSDARKALKKVFDDQQPDAAAGELRGSAADAANSAQPSMPPISTGPSAGGC